MAAKPVLHAMLTVKGRLHFPIMSAGVTTNKVVAITLRTPRDYFQENPEILKVMMKEKQDTIQTSPAPQQEPQLSFIDNVIMEQTLSRYDINPLYTFLARCIGHEETDRLCRLYRIGTSRKWGGAAVFWQVDCSGRVRTGKIMLYDATTGKRVKHPQSHVC